MVATRSMSPYAPAHVQALAPSIEPLPANVVRLDLLENPLGPSPLAARAMVEAGRMLHLYPDSASHALLVEVAQHLGVAGGEVFLGQGSTEIIELLIRTFSNDGDSGLVLAASHPVPRSALLRHGRKVTEAPRGRDGVVDLELLRAHVAPTTRFVFLVNPDTPTGALHDEEALRAFAQTLPPDCFLVIDEAYFEYRGLPPGAGAVALARSLPNVIAVRTLSKAHGLAGLRLGYAVLQPQMVEYLNRARLPFNMSNFGQAAAGIALGDEVHLNATREHCRDAQAWLTRELRGQVQVRCGPAPFVLLDLPKDARAVHESLLSAGIATCWPGPPFARSLRVTCGHRQDLSRLLATLPEVL